VTIVNAFRSETIRTFRRRLMMLGFGLAAVFGILTTVVTFTTAAETQTPGGGPQSSFATIAELEAADGFLGGFTLLGRLLGVAVLAIWALSVSSDYDSGFIRLLAQAEPNRLRLFVGKVGSLVCFTVIMSMAALFISIPMASPLAKASDISTDAWSDGMVSELLGGIFNLTLSMIAWGAIGLLIAMKTKNSGVAIGVGVGWLLLIEPIVTMVSSKAASYLPGGTIGALTVGGTDQISWIVGLLATLVYICLALGGSYFIFRRRDITD
jgi:ABC-2 type transport system permease protein